MAELSERQRMEKAKERVANLKSPKNPDDLKVIFRCTPDRKRRLLLLAEHYNVTMTEILTRSIDAAWHHVEGKLEE